MHCYRACVEEVNSNTVFFRFSSRLRSIFRKLERYQQLAAQRRQLATLNDMELKDFGVSRADVYQEVRRPFWDDPLDE